VPARHRGLSATLRALYFRDPRGPPGDDGPGGLFLTACPTVIIDEGMLRSGMTGGFHFQGVLAVDYEGERPPDLFRTWNAKPAVYMIDDDQMPQGSSGIGTTPGCHASRREHKTKQRSKMAKASRKRSRPK